MSAPSPDELLAIGDRLVGRAAPGEQVEVFVARGDSTEVRVYGGEVEHFVSAHSEGVGVRVISGGRTGTSYAGTLDPNAVDEVLDEARANAAFGTPDEFAGLVEPDGVDTVPIELWDERLPATSTEDKIALVTELERITLGLDPRVRVDEADYSDGGCIGASISAFHTVESSKAFLPARLLSLTLNNGLLFIDKFLNFYIKSRESWIFSFGANKFNGT